MKTWTPDTNQESDDSFGSNNEAVWREILSVYGPALTRAVTGNVSMSQLPVDPEQWLAAYRINVSVASGHLDVIFPNNLIWLTEVKVSFLQTHDGVAAHHLQSLDD